MLPKLNDSNVSLRTFNGHGSTVILLLFEYAHLEVLEAVLESLPNRRQQHGEILICVLVNLNGDTGPSLATQSCQCMMINISSPLTAASHHF